MPQEFFNFHYFSSCLTFGHNYRRLHTSTNMQSQWRLLHVPYGREGLSFVCATQIIWPDFCGCFWYLVAFDLNASIVDSACAPYIIHPQNAIGLVHATCKNALSKMHNFMFDYEHRPNDISAETYSAIDRLVFSFFMHTCLPETRKDPFTRSDCYLFIRISV